MSFWLHSTILATTLAASVAVGGAALYDGINDPLVVESDRLPLAGSPLSFVAVEAPKNGVSVRSNIPLGNSG
jgi:hypothetical protein